MNSKNVNIIRRLALLASALFLAAMLMGPSCLEWGERFSHKTHVKKESVKCKICHEGSEDGVSAGIPDPEVCITCHEEAEKYSAIAEEIINEWPPLKALPPDGKFSHKKHADEEVKCEACHGKIEKSNKTTFAHMPTEDTCLECHRKRSGATECSKCHQKINRETAPPDHSQSWERFHGESARDPTQGDRCFRCHNRNTCASCHSTEKPQDHTYAWKNFGHGTESMIDRSRCATCHKTDYCVRCHQETPPVSHRGGWGSPSDRHCNECHISGGADNCKVCHGARVKHPSAAPTPRDSSHAIIKDCRACHTVLKHSDNGENCRICHR